MLVGEDGLKSQRLLAHQEEAVSFLLARDRAVLADDMGLGKTRAVAAAVIRARLFPAVVVCEPGLREMWREEIRSLCQSVGVQLPVAAGESLRTDGFVLVGQSRVRSFFSAMTALMPACLVIDEAHLLRTSENESEASLRRVAAAGLVSGRVPVNTMILAIAQVAHRVFALTGTPVMSRPRELFPLLKLVRHPLARDFRSYALRYCAGVEKAQGIEADGASHIPELLSLLSTHFLRRRRADVLRLPPKSREIVWEDLPEAARARYELVWGRYVSDARRRLRGGAALNRATAAWRLTLPTLLDEVVSTSKVPAMFARYAQAPDKPTAMFTTRTATLSAMATEARAMGVPYVLYHGGMNEGQKASAVREFQGHRVPLFLGNMLSVRHGITLTTAQQAFLANVCWSPAEQEQVEDRLCRIGQENAPHFVYFMARNTTDQHRWRMLQQKALLTASLLAGDYVSRVPDDDVEL